MHFAFIAETLPSPKMTGAGLHIWNMAQQALSSGHKITHIIVGNPDWKIFSQEAYEEVLKELTAKGINVIDATYVVDERSRKDEKNNFLFSLSKWRQTFNPSFKDYERFFSVDKISPKLIRVLNQLSIDSIFVFSWGPIAALSNVDGISKLALPGDPTNLVYRAQLRLFRYDRLNILKYLRILRTVIMLRRLPKWFIVHLKKYDAVAWSAAQHAAWLNYNGIRCSYIPTAAVDETGADVEKERKTYTKNVKPKIVHLGHLGGTAAMTGIYLLMNDVVPKLEKKFGDDGFELCFIGHKDISSEHEKLLQRKNVVLRGFVDDLRKELLTADIFIVPIPHKVGMRTRLITGLSFGCCVVAHESCQLGNPELIHGHNVLLGRNGKDIARQVITALSDAELRCRLRAEARKTYQQYFSPEVASAKYIAELIRVAGYKK